MNRRLSVRNAVANVCTRTALDILAMEKFSDICAEIAHIVFHMERLESLAISPFFCAINVHQ